MALGATEAMIVAALIVCSLGRGGYTALVNADTLARLPNEWIATGAALIASAQSAIILAVNPLIGSSVDATDSYVPSLVVIAAFAVVPYALWTIWRAAPSRA
jgi:hypothetical protein